MIYTNLENMNSRLTADNTRARRMRASGPLAVRLRGLGAAPFTEFVKGAGFYFSRARRARRKDEAKLGEQFRLADTKTRTLENRKGAAPGAARSSNFIWRLIFLAVSLGKQANRDNHRGHHVHDGSEDPHETAGEYLVVQRGQAKDQRRDTVGRVQYAVAERKESSERAARQRLQKQVKRNGPAGAPGHSGKWLDHGPPEHDGSGEKTKVLEFVPGFGAQRELK